MTKASLLGMFKHFVHARMIAVLATGVGIALIGPTSTFAQGVSSDKLAARFAAADTDHDGRLSRAEAEAGMPRVAKHFDQIDTARNGSVTLEQIESAFQKRSGS